MELVEQELTRFITTHEPEVISLVGAWGVGKTYTWQRAVKDNLNQFARKKYSYVSVFGLDSISELKRQIFMNVVGSEGADSAATFESFQVALATLDPSYSSGKFRKTIKAITDKFSSVPYIQQFMPKTDIYSLTNYSDTLICSDDIERAGDGLNIHDLMGFVSFLKEARKAKVVLLLNPDQAKGAKYLEFREKVVDTELHLVPLAENSLDIVFGSLPHDCVKATLYSVVKKLEINNIRILQKIARSLNQLEPLLESSEDKTIETIVSSLVLLQNSSFTSLTDQRFPSLDHILKEFCAYPFDEDGESEQVKQWRKTLLKVDFISADEIDVLLAKGVESGVFDIDALKPFVDIKNSEARQYNTHSEYSDAWRDFFAEFRDESTSEVKNVADCFLKNVDGVSLSDANSLVTLLRLHLRGDCHEIKQQLLDKVISVYAKSYADRREAIDTELQLGNIDEVLSEAIHEACLEKNTANLPVEIAIEKLFHSTQQHKYVAAASTASIEQFYEFFLSDKAKSSGARYYIREVLSFENYAGHNSEYFHIAHAKAVQALQKISERSIGNRFILGQFGL